MAGPPVPRVAPDRTGRRNRLRMEAPPKPSATRQTNWWVGLAYVVMVVIFVGAFCRFYLPGKGFTYVINFGGKLENRSLSKLRKLDHFVLRHSDGYDAQFYAQIALDPSLQNKQLLRAVDNLPYRARRILFSATAYVLGLGQPAWILQAYAVQNAICWLLLAWILLRWFPATDWTNFVRWAGVLFSLGFCLSVRNALLDGPSLLLIAVGVLLVEKNRPWLATVVLGLGGLSKETNLLGSASLLPAWNSGRKAWGGAVLRGMLTAAPLALWVAYLSMHFGPPTDAGARNFAPPFVAYGHIWQATIGLFAGLSLWPLADLVLPLANLTLLIALTVQFLYLVLRPQWQQAWWRVGISFALLMVFLGDAVWEGAPSAAARVLLPMQIAFNVLVPARRWWLLVLLLGNLSVFIGPAIMDPAVNEGFEFRGDTALRESAKGQFVTVAFDDGWYGVERDGFDYWLWASGNSAFVIRNPHPDSLLVRCKFSLSPNGARQVFVRLNGEEVWRTTLADTDSITTNLKDLELRPGENRIEFLTDVPAGHIGTDTRSLAFQVINLRFELLRKLAVTPGK